MKGTSLSIKQKCDVTEILLCALTLVHIVQSSLHLAQCQVTMFWKCITLSGLATKLPSHSIFTLLKILKVMCRRHQYYKNRKILNPWDSMGHHLQKKKKDAQKSYRNRKISIAQVWMRNKLLFYNCVNPKLPENMYRNGILEAQI